MTKRAEEQAPPRPRGQRAARPKISCTETEAVTHPATQRCSHMESIWSLIITLDVWVRQRSPGRRCWCSGKELGPRRSSASDLRSGWCPGSQQERRLGLQDEDVRVQSRAAYPLSDLSLVPERQKVDVRLQRAGVDHGLVPGTGKALSAPASSSTAGEEEPALTAVYWRGCRRRCSPPR